MKTISLSALILIAFPVHAFAQDAEQSEPLSDSYYAEVPVQVEYRNLPSKLRSTRNSNHQGDAPSVSVSPLPIKPSVVAPARPAAEIKQIAKRQPIDSFAFEAPQVSASDYLVDGEVTIGASDNILPTIQQATKLQEISGGDFNPNSTFAAPVTMDGLRVASREAVHTIRPPQVAPESFPGSNSIVKPSPQNASQFAESNQPIIESVAPSPVPQREYKQFVEQTSVRPESVSLDQMRMSQRVNSWEEQPNTMRNVGDHFSPGGEPFANRGVTGNANFFGVDRNACCDEWQGHCNCGGLKGNPGHLGIPWLRSKDSCDASTSVLGNRRVRNAGNSCGCQDCCGQ